MSANRKTANAFFQALENKNLSQVSNLLSQNLKYYNHPRPSSGGLDKDKFLTFLSNLTFIERWDFGYKDPISFVENEKENELVLHFSAVTYATWGQTYDSEFIWFIHFDREGKIDGLKEFFDTLYRQTILADVKAKAESA